MEEEVVEMKGGTGEVVRSDYTNDEMIVDDEEIEDDGLPFDPTVTPSPDPDTPLDDRQIGGLGLFLARSLSDELHYVREHGMNRTTAIFRPASHHD